VQQQCHSRHCQTLHSLPDICEEGCNLLKSISLNDFTQSVGSLSQIRTTPSHVKLTNGSNKPECFITLGWKDLSETNIQAYWARS
jgi:hypothetical protein